MSKYCTTRLVPDSGMHEVIPCRSANAGHMMSLYKQAVKGLGIRTCYTRRQDASKAAARIGSAMQDMDMGPDKQKRKRKFGR